MGCYHQSEESRSEQDVGQQIVLRAGARNREEGATTDEADHGRGIRFADGKTVGKVDESTQKPEREERETNAIRLERAKEKVQRRLTEEDSDWNDEQGRSRSNGHKEESADENVNVPLDPQCPKRACGSERGPLQ